MKTLTFVEAAGFIIPGFLLSMLLSRLLIKMGPSLGLMDEPDARRVHLTPIPRAGGIAIWLAFLAVAWMGNWLMPEAFEGNLKTRLTAFTLSSALLIAVGVVDDRGGMSAFVKLGGQMAAAALFFWVDPTGWGNSIFGYDIPIWMSGLFFVGWCVLLINAFNLIDGLDGLCSGLVLISLFVVAGLELTAGNPNEGVFILTMAAAVGGFLRYNLNPAKIFLGDAGSMMLGFFLATAATQVGGQRAVIGSIVLPIAIAGVPLLDVLLAVWRRSARNRMSRVQGGKKVGVFAPDKDHLHHRFLAMGLTQRKVALILQGFAVVLAFLAFIPMLVGGRGLVITLCGFVILGLFGLRHFARVELLQTGSLLHLAVKRRTGAGAVRACYYLYDLAALAFAGALAIIIETNFNTRDVNGVWSPTYLLLYVTGGIVALQALRFYRRVWSRPATREFGLVAIGLTLAGMITSGIYAASNQDVTWSDFRCGFIASQLAIWVVLAPRSLPEVVREYAMDSKHRKLRKSVEGRKQVLVYGAGTMGTLFIEFVKNCSPEEFDQFQISGFLDDNENLMKRSIQEFKIHGGLDQLETITRKFKIHGIVVTISELDDEDLERIIEKAGRVGLAVYRWQADRMPQMVAPTRVAASR